jgi:hypothetical protein
LCQIANNIINPKTPTATPIMIPNVDVDEEEEPSSSDDNPFDDIGGGHIGIGGLHDQGVPGTVGYGGEGVSSDGGGT